MFSADSHYVEHTFRVRYAETDQMGVVHHAAYIAWFEMGRTEYSIAMGLPYSALEKSGAALMVAGVNVRYKKPCHYEEMLTLKTTISEIGSRKVIFKYELWRKDTNDLISEAETIHIAMSLEKGRPSPMTREVQKVMAPHLVK